jgi:hypothetical protein
MPAKERSAGKPKATAPGKIGAAVAARRRPVERSKTRSVGEQVRGGL